LDARLKAGHDDTHDAPPSAVSILGFKARIRLLRRAKKTLPTEAEAHVRERGRIGIRIGIRITIGVGIAPIGVGVPPIGVSIATAIIATTVIAPAIIAATVINIGDLS